MGGKDQESPTNVIETYWAECALGRARLSLLGVPLCPFPSAHVAHGPSPAVSRPEASGEVAACTQAKLSSASCVTPQRAGAVKMRVFASHQVSLATLSSLL